RKQPPRHRPRRRSRLRRNDRLPRRSPKAAAAALPPDELSTFIAVRFAKGHAVAKRGNNRPYRSSGRLFTETPGCRNRTGSTDFEEEACRIDRRCRLRGGE